MNSNSTRARWSPTTKAFVAAILLVLAAYSLTRLWVVIPPLIIATILAYILSPLVGLLQHRLNAPRWLATFVVYLLLVAILVLVPALIIPVVVQRLALLVAAIEDILARLETIVGGVVRLGEITINSAQLIEQTIETIRNLIQPVFSRTLGFAFELLSTIVMGVFVLVISFYLVKDSVSLRRWLRTLPPEAYREDFRRLWTEINLIWSSFFRGQFILAMVVAAGFIIVGYAIGLPFALAMGVLAGLLEFLPSIGHAIWLTIASILAFFLGSTWLPIANWVMLIIVLGLHSLFAQFDLNFLIPRIIGRRVNLHPLVVILGIIAGASVAGVLGVILAAPSIATARVLGRYLFANLFDENPFPDAEEPIVAGHEPS